MDQERVLNRYRLEQRLAAGGSAEVWRADDEVLDRPVAVKLLHAHLLPDATSRRRLAAEARAVAVLSHPGIVEVYDVDAEGQRPAIVMELVEGESLAARVRRDGPLPPPDAARVTADLADALYHAHRHGIVHRDVKPGNVLLGSDGRTRLLDFGIAHSLAAAEHLTQTGSVVGTLRYMAPEQLAGGRIGPRTDLYGLGLVLHEALTGRSPFEGVTPAELVAAQQAGPSELAGIEPALATVVAACLQPDPANRPRHAGAVAAALRAWLAGDPTPALGLARAPAVSHDALTEPMPALASTGATGSAASGRASRWRPMSVLLSLAALLAGGAVVAMLIGSGGARVGDASPTPTLTASPTPRPTPVATPVPEWVADLLEDYVKDCGSDEADQVLADISDMTEDAADEYVDELIKDCKEADKDDNRGKGNGGGNGGGGNGRGG